MANNDVMLSNVIGAPFDRGVLAQLYMRAYKNSAPLTSQANDINPFRSTDQILFLANKTAWVRLISSVDIILPPSTTGQAASQTDLTKYYTELGLDTSTSNQVAKYVEQNSLARNWVLEAGTSITNGDGINLRFGLGNEGSYGLGGIYEQGYRPMPGLTSVNIDTAGRLGSLRYADINFKVWNMDQLNAVEALYFRLGYSMLLEWGHTQYYTNEGTLRTNDVYGISDPFRTGLRKEAVQQEIAKKAGITDYNYDGMLGIVTNFTWAFNQEGGYDCTVKLIGLGSIIDSLRINQAYKLPNGLITNFKNAKKYLEYLQQQAIAKQAAAALQQQGGGATQPTASLPPPPTDPASLLKAIKTDDPSTNITQLDQVQYYASSGVDREFVYYYKSTSNRADAANRNVFGLFLHATGVGANKNTFTGRISPTSVGPSIGSLDLITIRSLLRDYLVENNSDLKQALKAAEDSDINRYGSSPGINNYIANLFYLSLANIPESGDFRWKDLLTVARSTPTIVSLGSTLQYLAAWFSANAFPNTTSYNRNNNIRRGVKIDFGDYVPNRVDAFNFAIEYVPDPAYPVTDYPLPRISIAKSLDEALTRNDGKGTITEIKTDGKFVSIVFEIRGVPMTNVQYSGKSQLGTVPPVTVTPTFRFYFNNPSMLIGSGLLVPPTTPPGNQAGAGNSGNTSGATNTPRSDQDNDAFESALVAMLAYVKTTTQAANKKNQTVFSSSLAAPGSNNATKIFYQDGVLQGLTDVDFQQKGAFTPTTLTRNFELTDYARKGFSTALMRDPSLYGSTPDVDFYKLCRSYLVKYGQGSNNTIPDMAASRVYIPLGYLLAFLNNMCLIYDTTANLSTAPTDPKDVKHPYLYIDFNPETNFCLTVPEQLSVDPMVCLIPFEGDKEDYKQIYDPVVYKDMKSSDIWVPDKQNLLYDKIPRFKVDGNNYQGKIMNILMDVDYLLGIANSFATADPEQSVNLKRFLETMMVDVNKALGGYNVFRVTYVDESNTIQIRDDQYTPNPNQTTLLDRNNYIKRTYKDSGLVASNYLQADISSVQYGQLPVFGLQSLVRNFQFKTNMSTKLASMIAISAQAQTGSINAKDGSTLAYLNRNYQDRYKPRIVNPSQGPVGSTQQGGKKQTPNNDITAAETFNTHIKSIYFRPETFDPLRAVTAKNYFIERSALVKTNSVKTVAAPFIPADCELTIDGIGGILMGQAFTIPEDRIPNSLKDPLDGYTNVGFIVAGVNHTIDNNEWLTKIKGQMIILRNDVSPSPDRIISRLELQQAGRGITIGSGVQAESTIFVAQGADAKIVAETYLGRGLSSEEWNQLIAVTSAESENNENGLEDAYVVATVLNRAREKGQTITQILNRPNAFQPVTGTIYNGHQPVPAYIKGPESARAEEIYTAIKTHLAGVNKGIKCFTAMNPKAYKAGTNIGYRAELLAKPVNKVIGGNKGTVFAVC